MQVLNRLGLDDYFLYPQIHWEPKSGSIQQIAKSLNIGIDSLALVDDTAFERNQVSSVHPQVRTYDACEISNLLSRPEFDVPVTAESRNRRAMYKAEEKRTAMMEGSHADLVEFIRKSNLKIHVFAPKTEDEKLRCYELVVRTNQLNMSGVKYTPEEFTAVLARPDHHNFAFTCADDFGSYGIVGYGQYRIEGETMIFTEFAMSCRVAGKFVESALFSYLLRQSQCRFGNFIVQITIKNALLRSTLEAIGFISAQTSKEHVQYSFSADLLHCDIVSV
jgi:FkbH-like protein